jgi:hypothetical protein
LLSAVIFVIAGPAIGALLQQTQRIVVYVFRLARGGDMKSNWQSYNTLRLRATAAELAQLDLMESNYDFNVSTGVALSILFAAYAYTHWRPPITDWILAVAAGLLFLGAYYSKVDFGFTVNTLLDEHKIA